MNTAKNTLQLSSSTRVVYCKTKHEAELGCKLIQINSTDQYALWSFDCEWKISFIRGHMNPISLMQFGRDDIIVLFHVVSCGLQQSIIDILLNPRIVKVGANISGDIQKIQRDFGRLMGGLTQGACDLRTLSRVTGVPPQLSLAGLVETELGAILPKPQSTRCGDWEVVPLSYEQQKYAALDVYAGYLVCLRILDRWRALRQVEGPSRPKSYPDGLTSDTTYVMICKNTCDASSARASSTPSSTSSTGSAVMSSRLVEHTVTPLFAYSSRKPSRIFSAAIVTPLLPLPDPHKGVGDSLVQQQESAKKRRRREEGTSPSSSSSSSSREGVPLDLHPGVRDMLRRLPDLVLSLSSAHISTVGTRKRDSFQKWCGGMAVATIAKEQGVQERTAFNHIITCIENGVAYNFSWFNISADMVDRILAAAVDVYSGSCFPLPEAKASSSAAAAAVAAIPVSVPPKLVITRDTRTASYLRLGDVKHRVDSSYGGGSGVVTFYDLQAVCAHMSRTIGRNWLWKLVQTSRSTSHDEDSPTNKHQQQSQQ
jgi:hypothetical protein